MEHPMHNLHAVIMAGGVGSRFWPYSRNSKPKQFLDVLDCGQSLLQLTFARLSAVLPPNQIWVVSHIDYSELVSEQLPEIDSQRILLEPGRKNTAACIMYATRCIELTDPEASVFVVPSDHLILHTENFNNAVAAATDFVNHHSDNLLTFGIKASRPDTGYGYIQFENEPVSNGIHQVIQFVEKPDYETALRYLSAGNYVWNSGMFLWKNKCIRDLMKKYAIEIFKLFAEFQPGDDLASIYNNCPSISIDYAVMEKTDQAFVLPVDLGWTDLGTWASLYEYHQKDEQQNVVIGDGIYYLETNNCLFRNEEQKIIASLGINNLIVVNTPDALLICDKNKEQSIKQLAGELQKKFGNTFL
ncbi:MAG: mannose-1-phosphate guanylyltransferase [Saprospiraceae bacterium]|nr:mannose-1-phosphate guanylyltransferase [Saprospiraceae bacterium]